MTMARKDFEALASAVKEAHSGNHFEDDYKCVVRVVNNLLPYLRKSNPAFDNDRFIKACGLALAEPAARFTSVTYDERFALSA